MTPTTKPGEADLTALRAKFETWFCEDGNYEPEWLDWNRAGMYSNADTQNMFEAFQAGAALGTAPATPVPALPELWHAANAVMHMLPQIDAPRTSRLYAALRDAGVQPVPASEPVTWQYRQRVPGDFTPWGKWERCTEADHLAIQAKALHWGMECESRALCVAATTSPAPAPATQADAAGADQADILAAALQQVEEYARMNEELRAMVDAAGAGQEAAAVQAEPIAWESTTEVFKRFVTDRWYQKSSEAVKRWYKPYRCSSCAALCPPVGGGDKG